MDPESPIGRRSDLGGGGEASPKHFHTQMVYEIRSNLYHPGNKHTVGPTARNVSYQFAADIGFDVLREFWPDIARELKLPFRGISNQQDQDSRPNGN